MNSLSLAFVFESDINHTLPSTLQGEEPCLATLVQVNLSFMSEKLIGLLAALFLGLFRLSDMHATLVACVSHYYETAGDNLTTNVG